jgi:hypothetical protein
LRRLCCQISNLFLEATDPLVKLGLTQAELCVYFGFEESMIQVIANQLGLDIPSYLQQLTGWQLRQECFFLVPPALPSED